jgi:hypothetical protein
MYSSVQSTLLKLFGGLQAATVLCAVLLMVSVSSAEAPPLGSDAERAQEPPKQRTFDRRITMHEVSTGPGKISDNEEKPSRGDYFREKFLAPSFGSTPPSSYSMPVRPNRPRPKKDSEKKKNWVIPTSNLEEMGLEAPEENSLLEGGNNWGWLMEGVMESREENKQAPGETEEERLELDKERGGEFLTNENMENRGPEQLREEGRDSSRLFQAETYRPLTNSYSRNNIFEMEKREFSSNEGFRKADEFEGEPVVNRWKSSGVNKSGVSFQHSHLTDLNQSVRKNYSFSKTTASPKGANAYRSTSFQSGAFNRRSEPANQVNGFGSTRNARTGLSSSLLSPTPALSRPVYSLPRSSEGVGTLRTGSPQSPSQSYQPLDHQWR